MAEVTLLDAGRKSAGVGRPVPARGFTLPSEVNFMGRDCPDAGDGGLGWAGVQKDLAATD